MSSSKMILLYNGLGGGEDSTKHFFAALSHAVDPKYHSVKCITPEEIKEGSWTKSCCVIAFGGGYDLGFIKALGNRGTKIISDFVRAGGCYLGMCAGAYWACDSIEFDKGGPLQVVGERFLKFYPGQCIGPAFPGFRYNTKKGVHAVPVLYKGKLSFRSYMHGGGYFTTPESGSVPGVSLDYSSLKMSGHTSPNETDQTSGQTEVTGDEPQSSDYSRPGTTCGSSSSYTVLGTFTSLNSKPAAVVKCNVGQGMAILSGVHLEFPVSQLDDTNPDLFPVLPQLHEDESTRDFVFRDLLRQLNVHLRPVKSQL